MIEEFFFDLAKKNVNQDDARHDTSMTTIVQYA